MVPPLTCPRLWCCVTMAAQGLFVRPRSIQVRDLHTMAVLCVRCTHQRFRTQKYSQKVAALGKIQAWARMLHAKAVVEDETNFQVFTALDEDLERVRPLVARSSYVCPCTCSPTPPCPTHRLALNVP